MELNKAGITYKAPEVILLQDTGLGVPELAARTCYDSFENSENDCIRTFHNGGVDTNIDLVNNIESSELLGDLAWTYFHHSILEHTNLSFLVKGTSRGVLQEHARHRIQAISVRSTRYTMSSVINAYIATFADHRTITGLRRRYFINKILEFDMFVTNSKNYNELEAGSMFDKLDYQYNEIGREAFIEASLSKSSISVVQISLQSNTFENLFQLLQAGKKKRNVGDAFKHIVTDNWKVDMVVTFNLRSLKNYFDLRDSGAAYFQIRNLAKAMKAATPEKYLKLIDKSSRENNG
jgi:thymidylate synthase (FAD)